MYYPEQLKKAALEGLKNTIIKALSSTENGVYMLKQGIPTNDDIIDINNQLADTINQLNTMLEIVIGIQSIDGKDGV